MRIEDSTKLSGSSRRVKLLSVGISVWLVHDQHQLPIRIALRVNAQTQQLNSIAATDGNW